MQQEETAPDLLTNFDNRIIRADAGKRFLNYIIDLGSFYIFTIVLGILIGLLFPSSIEFLSDDSLSFGLADRIITILLYGVYMSLVESVFKGKSLGKLVTKTRAVNLDGSKIKTGTAFERGFSRAVPFCVFSALGSPCNPWQDRWTKTVVIDEKQSYINNDTID